MEIILDSSDRLDILRHSTAHLMAQAVQRIFPTALKAIGPTTKDGFFYDFDLEHPIVEEDLISIEKEMRKIVKEKLTIEKEVISKQEAIKLFEKMGEIYKVEILKGIADDTVSIYRQGEFIDLCRGPHVANTNEICSFKLKNVSGAYWRNDSQNKMLQRVYGYAFQSEKDLEDHLNFLIEAEKRDHRRLGRELGLFFIDKYSPGSPFFLPKGMVLRNILEDISKEEHKKAGYSQIKTPTIMKQQLWEISGHLENYLENMYITDAEKDNYAVKPMSCPGAMLLFKNEIRSYKDLPFKVSEMGNVFRKELSGAVHGLMRMREFTQDDAHIFLDYENIEGEIIKVIELVDKFYGDIFKFKYTVELSTRPDKYIGSIEQWDKAVEALKASIETKGLKFKINEGDGAFYGPKIDFKVEDAIGRLWQCATIQLDFNLAERFDLSYVGSDGEKHRPLIVHRAIYGSIERFMGILIEHYEGRFPFWLAPIQVVILTVSEKSLEYGEELVKDLGKNGIRVELYGSSEKIGQKIKRAFLNKIPLQVVVGEKEANEGMVSVRELGKESEKLKRDIFLKEYIENLKKRK